MLTREEMAAKAGVTLEQFDAVIDDLDELENRTRAFKSVRELMKYANGITPEVGPDKFVLGVPKRLDKVQKIITGAGGKSYRRPYTEDDMQVLRSTIEVAIEKWANDELCQLDVKNMALDALELAILYIYDEGETAEDINGFKPEVMMMCKNLIGIFGT